MAEDSAGSADAGDDGGDTFGVGVHVTDEELRIVVQVPSDIDSGWTSREQFQSLVQEAVWERLDREATLQAVAASTQSGETTMLGTVTLTPDGTVTETVLETPGASR